MTNKDSKTIEEAYKYIRKGQKLQSDGRIDESIDILHQSLDIYPTTVGYISLAYSYSLQKHYDIAVELCNCAIDIDPSYPNSFNDKGAYFLSLGEIDKAEECLLEAIRLGYTRKHLSYFNLGIVYSQRNGENWYRALQYFKQSIAIEPDYQQAVNAYYSLLSMLN